MIRNLGNLSKIGFSRITRIPATGLIFSNRKLSEKIPDKNSINSIIDELKKDINKLESEMGRSIVAEKDDPFERKALQPRVKPIPQTDKIYKEQEYKTLHLETIKYTVDEEPKQREIKIELKQDEDVYGFKHTKISQNIENGEEYGFCYNHFLIHGPEDVSRLSDAMQALEFEWPEKYAKALRQDKPSMLCQQLVVKVNVGSYKLAIELLPNKQLNFQMETILAYSNHKLWKLRGPIPIEVFYWLKAQIAEIAEISVNCDDHEFVEEDEEDEDEIYSDDDE